MNRFRRLHFRLAVIPIAALILAAGLPYVVTYGLYAVFPYKPLILGFLTADILDTCLTVWRIMLVLAGTYVITAHVRATIIPIYSLDNEMRNAADGRFDIRVPDAGDTAELLSLQASFAVITDELRRVEKLRSGIIHDVSHEFKIPLTTISGYARIIHDSCGDNEIKEYSATIMGDIGRLTKLVDNILTLNRLDRHSQLEIEAIQLDEQIRRVLAVYEPAWRKKRVDFRVELEEVVVIGYGGLLMQIWTNLVDNAVKFTPEGGTVDIELENDALSEGIVFTIRDSGDGIGPGQVRHIFESFFQADNSRGTEGNGLGLAIVSRIVQIHGGTIAVKSKSGEGATFTVKLPCQVEPGHTCPKPEMPRGSIF